MVKTILPVVINVIQCAQGQSKIPRYKVFLFINVSTMFSKGARTYGCNFFAQHP